MVEREDEWLALAAAAPEAMFFRGVQEGTAVISEAALSPDFCGAQEDSKRQH